MQRMVRIGGAGGFGGDSPRNVAQLLNDGVDYLVFDSLAESVMGSLGAQRMADPSAGWVRHFVDRQIGPFLHEIGRRGVKVISNAGGLNPSGCAKALRERLMAEGLSLNVASIDGDNLGDRIGEYAQLQLNDMQSGRSLQDMLDEADEVLSFTAYIGGFPIAQALASGADIVIAGRSVDTAPTLGALIHEFGWTPDDLDQLASGTALGHILECGTAGAGGTFTDWRDVPNWENMGSPIAECLADGSGVITKPAGTGGLVSVASISEQLLYEVADIGGYIVPDVICDWSGVSIIQEGPDRVRLSGAKAAGRSSTYKAVLTYHEGWKGVFTLPIVGMEAMAKAERMADALMKRLSVVLDDAGLQPWRRSNVEIVGDLAAAPNSAGSNMPRTVGSAICRIAVDHAEQRGAELLLEEGIAFIAHVVGMTMPLQSTASRVQRIGSFLIDKASVALTVEGTGSSVAAPVACDAVPRRHPRQSATIPTASIPATEEVQLCELAWGRSGDKGNDLDIAVIAREERYLPYIAETLTPEFLGKWAMSELNLDSPALVEQQYAPRLKAIKCLFHNVMDGGHPASMRMDTLAKGLGQRLLAVPIAVPAGITIGDMPALSAMNA